MSVSPGSVSPGVDFVAGAVQPRGLRVAKERTAVWQHGQRLDMWWSVHMCLLEALYSVDGTRHGKRSEKTGDGTPPLATFRCRISRAQEL